VDEVADEPDAVIERLVGELATSGAAAARAAKRLVLAPVQRDELIRLAARIRTGDEGQEGLRAFLEKREAEGGWGVYARRGPSK
jgi:enoyl-CoA hydratase/carnithine racemase